MPSPTSTSTNARAELLAENHPTTPERHVQAEATELVPTSMSTNARTELLAENHPTTLERHMPADPDDCPEG